MKRILAPALLSLVIGGGCGGNAPPDTAGNCHGTITVNLSVPGGINMLKYVEATDLDKNGARFTQTGTPPLAVSKLVILPGIAYTPGAHVLRAFTADSAPSKSTLPALWTVSYVGRTTITTTDKDTCPSVQLALASPTRMDVCLDLCDANVRCGSRSFDAFNGCQAACQANAAMFTAQQDSWLTSWTDYYNRTSTDPKADTGKLASDKVQQLIGQYEACDFASCDQVQDCGSAVLQTLVPPAQ